MSLILRLTCLTGVRTAGLVSNRAHFGLRSAGHLHVVILWLPNDPALLLHWRGRGARQPAAAAFHLRPSAAQCPLAGTGVWIIVVDVGRAGADQSA